MITNIKILKPFKFLFEPARAKVCWGGRGSGKSVNFASVLLVNGIQQQEKILCCREFQSSIRDSVHSLLKSQIEKYKLDSFYNITRDSILGENGTEFIFAGVKQNPSKIKSINGVTKAWIEEGQVISQESLDILIPTIREPNSEIWVSMNTGTIDDPIYRYYIKNKVPDSIVKKINYDQNCYFPEVLRKEMEYCREHDVDKYNTVWLGEPSKISDAAIFKGKVKIEAFETPKDTVFYYGCDFGFANSPLVIIRCYIDHENRYLYIDKGKMATGVEIIDTPRWLEDYIPDIKEWVVQADCARPEIISYLRNEGFVFEPSKKGPNSVKEGIEFLKNYTIIIHESLKDIIYEFLNYSYKVDKHSGFIIPEPEKKNDNAPDALRYALEALRNRPDYSLVVPD